VLSTNNWVVIKARISDIASAIEGIPAGGFSFVDIDTVEVDNDSLGEESAIFWIADHLL
jgi:hypothetical protein